MLALFGGDVRDSLTGERRTKPPVYAVFAEDRPSTPPSVLVETENHVLGMRMGKFLHVDLDAWENVCDFTCNIFYRDTTSIGLRFVPPCMEDLPDPFGTAMEHIHRKKLCICLEYPYCFDDARHVTEKMVEMMKRGWSCCTSWPAMRIEDDTVHLACGHAVPLSDWYKHIIMNDGPVYCPVKNCLNNPLIEDSHTYQSYEDIGVDESHE